MPRRWLGDGALGTMLLDSELRLGARATAVGAVGVAGEFYKLRRRELEDVLETHANSLQNLLALLGRPSLAACNVAVATTGDALADGASPHTDTEESLA